MKAMDPMMLRAFERLLVVAIGGLSVWLGYKLFLRMPDQKDSEGRVKLPGGVSIYMSRVGPGAFFALFGAAVVSLSFQYPITYTDTRTATGSLDPSGGTAADARYYAGVGAAPRTSAAQDSQADCLQMLMDIDFLDHTLPSLLAADLAANQRNQVDLVMRRMRRAGAGTCGDMHPTQVASKRSGEDPK
jgi:hypothetical protein